MKGFLFLAALVAVFLLIFGGVFSQKQEATVAGKPVKSWGLNILMLIVMSLLGAFLLYTCGDLGDNGHNPFDGPIRP